MQLVKPIVIENGKATIKLTAAGVNSTERLFLLMSDIKLAAQCGREDVVEAAARVEAVLNQLLSVMEVRGDGGDKIPDR